MARIAVVTENDAVWALTAWERALPLLAHEGHVVAGIWAVEPKLSRYRGKAIALWYLKRLGLFTFGKLAAFACLHRAARWWRQRPMTLEAMARAYGLPYFETASPNDAELVSWLRAEKVEVLLITVGHILLPEVLGAVRVGVINKHAGLLPANKGLWPYFWAVVKGLPQGVSYHRVNEKVDAGALLLRHSQIPEVALRSMIAYYAYVYGLFGQHMAKAVEMLLQHETVQGSGEDASPSPLPDAQAFATFREKGGVVMRISDLGLAVSLLDNA